MKYLILTVCSLISLFSFSQNKYITKNGVVSFEASVPSFEEVKATNKSVTAIINVENGEFAVLVLVKGFRFKNALMEEHFNENYAESDKFPKAIFKGKIKDFNIDEINLKPKNEAEGELTFHGISKVLEGIVINITKNEDVIILASNFKLNVSDFDIIIPKVVRNKVSENVEVSFEFNLKKK